MKYCIFDIETTGLNPNRKTEIFAYAFYFPEKNNVVIKRKDADRDFIPYLQSIFNDVSICKVCHNYKFEYSFLKRIIHIPKKTIWHCTLLMSQLLENTKLSHSLDYVFTQLTGSHQYNTIDERVSKYKKVGYDKISVPLFNEYQTADIIRTEILFSILFPEIKKDSIYKVYEMEIEFAKIISDMEDTGINLDRNNTLLLIEDMKNRFKKVQQDVYAETGQFINLHSGKQIKELLTKKYKFPVLQQTVKGNMQLNKDVLFEYKRMFPNLKILDLIIQWRSYKNGISTIQSYLDIFNCYGRVNPIINPNQALTGRQSAQDPNLQNVQKPEALKNLYPVNARQCFCCDENEYLLFADYKGIEIRLMTEITGEKIYKKMIENESGDPHDYAAKILLGERYNGEKILRDACKNAQFAIAYAAGKKRVEKTVNLKDIDYYGFKKKLPKIGYFSRNIMHKAKNGYVETSFGRRLYLQTGMEYMIGNHLIQSTAADILKHAIIRIDKYIKDYWQGKMKMIISIHDEIIFGMKKRIFDEHGNIIIKDISLLMTTFDEIKIPLKIEWKKTETTWDKAVKI